MRANASLRQEVSLSLQNDVRMSGHGMGDDERARVKSHRGFGACFEALPVNDLSRAEA
jgi:hypothetical protein